MRTTVITLGSLLFTMAAYEWPHLLIGIWAIAIFGVLGAAGLWVFRGE